MKVVYNNLIPFKGYKAINLFGIVFARKGAVLTGKDLNHEAIHTSQMKEMLYLFSMCGMWWNGLCFCQGAVTPTVTSLSSRKPTTTTTICSTFPPGSLIVGLST